MSRFLVVLVLFLQFIVALCYAGEKIRLKHGTIRLTAVAPVAWHSSSNQMGARFLPTAGKLYYIVQFNGPVRKQWKEELERAGVKWTSYLPDDAFLAKIATSEAWSALNAHLRVRAIVPFDSKYRMSSEFGRTHHTKAPMRVTVRLTDGSEFEHFLRHIRNLDVSDVNRLSERLVGLTAQSDQLEKIADIEGVEWVEPQKKLEILNFDVSNVLKEGTRHGPGDYTDLTGFESGTKLMHFAAAYERGYNGDGEIAGAADTGLDRGSTTTILEDFKGQVKKGYALGFFGFNLNNIVKWSDPQGHGTHVAGSIVGTGVSSGSILRGGAYGSKIVFESMWNTLLNNLLVLPDFEKLFGHVHVADGASIHSNSWGAIMGLGEYDNFAAMVDDIAWKYPEFLLIFAAGNSGQDFDRNGKIDNDSVGTPGTAKNILTVGASKNLVLVGGIQKTMKELRDGAKKWGVDPIASSKLSETPDGMAGFSSIGPTKDGRIKPEIVAPGTNIISAQSQHPQATKLWGAYNDLYCYAGGTSMATPLTAGAALVTRQYLRAQGLLQPSAALIKAVLVHTAFDLYPGQYGTGQFQEFEVRRPNMNEGFGRVDMDKATSIKRENLIDDKNGVVTGSSRNYEFEVKAGQTVQVTMVYTDAPASAGAAQALVNNLDLKVTDYEGNAFYPNHGDGPDNKNNTEMVEFVASHGGTYRIAVKGTNVPQGRPGTGAQPYALVVTSAD